MFDLFSVHPAVPYVCLCLGGGQEGFLSFVSFHAFWIINHNPNTTITHSSKIFLLLSSLQLGACCVVLTT